MHEIVTGPEGEAHLARRGRVLVIDDEPLVTRVLRAVLSAEHEIECAESAAEALDLLGAGRRYDAILCDLMMPEMGGIELHAALLERDPDQAARLVFMTGGAFTERAREFTARVPNPCVGKPFDLTALRALVTRLVG